MSAALIGKIERLPLRTVWAHEAYDFTTWLFENIDVLNEVIEPDLTPIEREKRAGDFSVDTLAEDSDGNPVVIENQLGRSDHDHLGKLLTYLSAFDAKCAIWIVGEPRPEHAAAITWLNEAKDTDFYLIKAEAVRIGVSEPALLLTRIVGPTEETKRVGQDKKEIAESHQERLRFWTKLVDSARNRTGLHSGISPSGRGWLGTSAGRTGLSLTYSVTKDLWRVELYIGTSEKEVNEAVLDFFLAERSEIEGRFGDVLEWQRLESKKASRIAYQVDCETKDLDDTTMQQVHDRMIDAMIRLEKAVRPVIERLPNDLAVLVGTDTTDAMLEEHV